LSNTSPNTLKLTFLSLTYLPWLVLQQVHTYIISAHTYIHIWTRIYILSFLLKVWWTHIIAWSTIRSKKPESDVGTYVCRLSDRVFFLRCSCFGTQVKLSSFYLLLIIFQIFTMIPSRVARFVLVQLTNKWKNLPIVQKIYLLSIKYTKRP
jgi:hypothetical protein